MSEAYLDLRDAFSARISDRYFEEHRKVELAREKETTAVGIIQRSWRGFIARKYIDYLNNEALQIERVWRGYRGREAAGEKRRTQVQEEERAFFSSMATIVQKVWRGYYSRKMKQDFYARKSYIQHVSNKGFELQDQIERDLEREAAEAELRREQAEGQEFTQITENLHHLISTEAIKGVFTSPYGENFATTAFGIPMETHIKDSFAAARQRDRQHEELERREKRRRVAALSRDGANRPKARGKGRGMGMPTPPVQAPEPEYYGRTRMEQQIARTQQVQQQRAF